MLQRFPELEPLLLQTSFTNKQAPWRGPKSGHTSHAPSRGHSLGVSREASFAQSRYAMAREATAVQGKWFRFQQGVLQAQGCKCRLKKMTGATAVTVGPGR